MRKKLQIIVFLIFSVAYSRAQSVQQVSFLSDTLQLSGEIHLPSGSAKVPGVILVHGSGPMDRHQTVSLNDPQSQCLYPNMYPSTVKNFRDIASGLSNNGIAVLVYDKRTYTYGTALNEQTISINDFIKDAHSAFSFLKNHNRVDSNKLYVAGHSQGALIVPYLSSSAKGVILLAGAISPVDSLIAAQIQFIYNKCIDSAQGYLLSQQTFQNFQQIRQNTWPPNQKLLGAYSFFWKSWIDKSDSVKDVLLMVNKPILALQGESDFNVPLDNLLRIRSILQLDSTNSKHYPNVNHFLTHDDSVEVSRSIIIDIANWIKNKSRNIGYVDHSLKENFNLTRYGNKIFIEILDLQHVPDKVLVYDLLGKKIKQMSFQKENPIIIDNEGVYVLQLIKDGNIIYTKKIVI